MLKKINPKITAIVVMLLSLLVAGGITLEDSIGGTTELGSGAEPDDSGLF